MLEALLHPIFFGPICLVAGAFIGVGLARRSDTANRYYDQIRAESKIREGQLRDQLARLQDKYNALKSKT